jgi:hypothetical protein
MAAFSNFISFRAPLFADTMRDAWENFKATGPEDDRIVKGIGLLLNPESHKPNLLSLLRRGCGEVTLRFPLVVECQDR